MDADFRFPSIYVPSTCTHRARPAPASSTRDTGRAAVGRAGSFIERGKSLLGMFRVNIRTAALYLCNFSAIYTFCQVSKSREIQNLARNSEEIKLHLPDDMLRFESTQDLLFRTAFETFNNTNAQQSMGFPIDVKTLEGNLRILAMLISQMSYLESKRTGIGPALFSAEVLKINTSSPHSEVSIFSFSIPHSAFYSLFILPGHMTGRIL